MPADHQPEVSCSLEGESEKEANHHDVGCAHPVFATIQQMYGPKAKGEQTGTGPVADHSGQGELQVAAKHELLGEADHDEEQQPEEKPLDNQRGIGKSKRSEAVTAKGS